MQTILITGGTGLIGRQLTKQLLAKGYNIIILTRSDKNKNNKNISYAAWDIKKQTIDINAVQAADFIIHLAGAPVVDKRWTAAYKKEIIESRTLSSKLLTDTLQNNTHKVKAIISASATGWYGEDKDPSHYFIESDEPSPDFLGQTCVLWEESMSKDKVPGIRVCRLRTGIVLASDGGALAEFKKPVKFGVAAILSKGNQIVSWIHIDDLCRTYIHAMENEIPAGSYNAVAPMPVSNKKLTIVLARLMRKKFFIPMHVPAFILKLMLGNRSTEVLKSVTVSCARIKATGFTFLYPSVESALNELLSNR